VHCRRTIPALFLSALVATTSFAVAAVPRPVGADQISDLQAQAKVISQQLIEEQLQVGAYQQQYSVASARVAADTSAIAQTDQLIAQDQSQIEQKASEVRRQAIRSYMDYGTGTSGPDSALFGGNQQTSQEASEYDAIGVGNITTALDELRTAQRTLQTHQIALRQQQAQDQADQTQRATTLSQANGSQQHLVSLQTEVTGQLATAVAAQAAAQAQAAAAAVASAQRAAAAKAPVQSPAANSPSSTSEPPIGAPVASGTDPALNPFLQCVVQAESGGNYQAVSPNGLYMGAFQFSQPTWNTAAVAAGRPDLVGVPPNTATKADQDTVAVALYALDGEQPWLGDRCS
jgi:peptidoglycan hydrolase CwlO-like protein